MFQQRLEKNINGTIANKAEPFGNRLRADINATDLATGFQRF